MEPVPKDETDLWTNLNISVEAKHATHAVDTKRRAKRIFFKVKPSQSGKKKRRKAQCQFYEMLEHLGRTPSQFGRFASNVKAHEVKIYGTVAKYGSN